MSYFVPGVGFLVPFLVGAGPSSQQPPEPPTQLQNTGFECAVLHERWTVHVYGAQPKLALGQTVVHEGRQALRVSAEALSDTAFGQEVRLQPGRWYRLTGWVRTDKLDPHGAPVYGTFQIQHPGGRGVVVSGRNHRGTDDWVRETICFTPPGDGLTRIAIFFVGHGQGAGTAWFDEIALEEIDTAVSTLTITRQPLCPGTISPFQYGQFIEYLCGLTLSMSAEQIHDGSFEGVPPYGFVFRKETDRIEKPWYPDGAVHRGEYALDADQPFNGRVAQRITATPGDPCTLGISQGGKFVCRGQPLKCSLHLRSQGLGGPVRVTLWGEGRTYDTAEFRPGPEWQKFEATLTPTESDANATLTISFRGPGTLWIDQVSLLPSDHVFGWRRDVAEALKAMKPGIIRFGGSATEGFDWTATIGDPAKRVPFTTCWGGLEPGNAGLEEFVQLCHWVGAEPLICVRFTGKTPKDAADQVEYFNGAATTPMGRKRAENGHAEPYRVKYWQIGNELGDEKYQQGLAAFCQAMKAVDPSIKLMAAFPSPGLLRRAGQLIDYICPHHYGCHNLPRMEEDVRRCRAMIAAGAPGRDIRLGITEWNTTAGDRGLRRAMLWTLENALACARYHNFMHRHCDAIEIANRSNLADSFCSGVIQTNNHALYKTPTYYVQELYANHAGQTPLAVRIDADLPVDPAVDTSTTLSVDGTVLSVFAVNPTGTAQQRTLDLTALAPLAEAVEVRTILDTLEAGERDAANSWREPDRIRTVSERITLSGDKLTYELPPLSVTLLKFRRRPHTPATK
ncbi:alpha-L-arabinofuranosidase C-terminal domain-containing protein [Planctomycetota bacterium]